MPFFRHECVSCGKLIKTEPGVSLCSTCKKMTYHIEADLLSRAEVHFPAESNMVDQLESLLETGYIDDLGDAMFSTVA